MSQDTKEILKDESTEPKTLIQYLENEEAENIFSSSHFKEKNKFISEIFNTDTEEVSTSRSITEIKDQEERTPKTSETYTDQIFLEPWKNIDNISSRLIEISDSYLILECLIDKDNGVYEERKFRANLFKDFILSEGKLFYLRFFERKNEVKMQIHDDTNLTLEEDFPKIDLKKKYKSSRLFKK